ncbi:HET-domain-containing protein, partial [Delitschia confertaspora ATCC 74209]
MPQPLYKPLNTEKREIRILVLRPSHRKYSRLKCELIQADLDALQDAPFEYYEAVSYTWGDTNGKKRISLNGHDFWITRNLHSLLQRLRAKRTRGYYWVDAICIDQQNIPERGQQVRLMKAIYESAEQTLVWLGPSNDDSDIAMDLMDEITDADEDANPSDDGEALLHRRVAHLQSSLTDPKDKRKWEALAKLFHRPWWKRVWIRQEV